MLSLVLAALVFLGIHVFISGTPLRDQLVARLGEKRYLGAFSLASALVLAWLIWSFADVHAPWPTAHPHLRWIAGILVLLAFLFVVIGVTTRGPTGVGGESLLDRPDPARGIHRITRHPFLVGMVLWAGVHMAFNPQADGLWFFGAFFVLALIGPRLIDAKLARRLGPRWAPFRDVTSVVPFAAIAAGRNRLALSEIALWQWGAAFGAYFAFLLLHTRLFGMPPL